MAKYIPYLMEYDLADEGLAISELQALSDLVVGNPIYVRRKDNFIAAKVQMVSVKPGSLVLTVKFFDSYLEKNIDNEKLVGTLYTFLDPINYLLGEAS